MESSIKKYYCEHNRQKHRCKDCGGSGICKHNKQRRYCKECGGSSICEHNRQRNNCKECGGSSICEHNRIRNACKECGGSSICEHMKLRSSCKECGGSSICSHNRMKNQCRDCNGASICEHNRLRHTCKDCCGASVCEHDRIRSRCKDCGGGSICEHDKVRSHCKECGGGSVCEHNRIRSRCKECGGGSICEHGRYRYDCPDCDGKKICKSRYEPYNTGCRTFGNRNLKGFCAHCFVNLFPDDPKALTVRKKSKEIQVVSYILSKIQDFIHDKPFYVDLEGGCCATKRRIDLRKLINNTMLCVEIDEEQHKKYIKENENMRYDDLFMDFSGKYIFIRYNPDKFKDKYGKMKNPFFETRVEVLEKAIEKHTLRIQADDNDNLVEIHHLFYDEV